MADKQYTVTIPDEIEQVIISLGYDVKGWLIAQINALEPGVEQVLIEKAIAGHKNKIKNDKKKVRDRVKVA